jgi:DNA-binding PadR family transcriptional regulator
MDRGLDNGHMAEFDANDFEGTLDFFILSAFGDGPRSLSEIQRRAKWAERLLYLAATRKGKRGPDSLSEALGRLQREGCIKFERLGQQSGADIIYSLTDAGEHRLEQERARRHVIVSEFVEDSELDSSFRKFLDSKSPLWSS